MSTAATLAMVHANEGSKKLWILKEKNRFNYVKNNLDEIIRKGVDRTIWSISTDASPKLPEMSRLDRFIESLFGTRSYLKDPKDSITCYLEKVFGTYYPLAFLSGYSSHFIFYTKDDKLIAKNRSDGKLLLYFDLIEKTDTIKQEEITLFTPHYTWDETEIIKAMLPIYRHILKFRYTHFSKDEYPEGFNEEASWPYIITYKTIE